MGDWYGKRMVRCTVNEWGGVKNTSRVEIVRLVGYGGNHVAFIKELI